MQILPDFSGVQSEFDRDLIKMRSIFGVPLSCGENGKNKRVFLRNWYCTKCDLCTMICLLKNETRNDHQKRLENRSEIW